MRQLKAVLLAQGCVVAPTEESKVVRSIDDDSDYKCKFLGPVTDSGSMGWTTAHDAEGAMNDVRNKAAKLGGNAIRVANIDLNEATTVVVADAYRCEFND